MYIGDAILHGYMGDHNKPLEGSLLNNQVVVPNIFLFLPLPEEMIQFDYYFSNGLKPPTRQPV